MLKPHEVIKRPLVSEKTVHLQNKLNQYTFEVHQDANRIQVREAVETLFKVKVLKVNTVTCRGTQRRIRTRLPGFSAATKKAIVTLADGQKIEGA
jgi:large subunit ribosomal protein L23